MVTESVKQHITAELRQLRTSAGRLDAAKLTLARAIVKGLGGDAPDVALSRLVDLAVEHADDRDIEAAMASIGWGVSATSSLDRLAEYSERHFVDPRTVRRWSDAGIRKLTMLILGTAPWIQPRARQVLSVGGNQIKIGIDLRLPPNLRMETPELWMNDRPIEICVGPIDPSPEPQRLRTGLDDLATISELPVRLRFSWTGEKLAIYEAVTHGTRDVHFNSRLVFRDLRTTISRWSGDVSRPDFLD
ncbi:MAG: hypothetical protein JWP19_2239 [Rhodoglobus sp.]|nr:hypothetical protein [Rhodoglobus sp.]